MNQITDPAATRATTDWLAQLEGILRLRDGHLGRVFDAAGRTSNFINYDIKYRTGDDLFAGDA